MNATARAARQIVKARSEATRLTASLRRGRSLATHVIAAGVERADVPGVVNGLRAVAKRLAVQPVRTVRSPRTINGRDGHGHRCGHYTTAQVQLIVANYSPRKPAYRAAVVALAA
jgi:hypothetical protein